MLPLFPLQILDPAHGHVQGGRQALPLLKQALNQHFTSIYPLYFQKNILFCILCTHCTVVMSKTKGQNRRSDIGLETKPKRFDIVPEFDLMKENRLFRFGPESAFLDQIEMISFDETNSGTNSNVLLSFLLDIGTFAERLWNVCSFSVLTLHTTLYYVMGLQFPKAGKKQFVF